MDPDHLKPGKVAVDGHRQRLSEPLDARIVADAAAGAPTATPDSSWASLGPSDLVDHISTVHHRYLWDELPRISALVDKFAAVHDERHPEPFEVQRVHGELRAGLETHLTREEQTLFPRIRQLAEAVDTSTVGTRGLAAQIESLAGEHETVGALLDAASRDVGLLGARGRVCRAIPPATNRNAWNVELPGALRGRDGGVVRPVRVVERVGRRGCSPGARGLPTCRT